MTRPDRAQFATSMVDATRLLRREFDRRVAHLKLTRVQWRALKSIGARPGPTQAELAERLETDPISLGRVLDRLQLAGFIERRADPGDRRCWRLHLAPGSDPVMAEVERLSRELRAQVLDDVSDEDLATTLRVLDQVKDTLLRMDKPAREPAPRARKRTAR